MDSTPVLKVLLTCRVSSLLYFQNTLALDHKLMNKASSIRRIRCVSSRENLKLCRASHIYSLCFGDRHVNLNPQKETGGKKKVDQDLRMISSSFVSPRSCLVIIFIFAEEKKNKTTKVQSVVNGLWDSFSYVDSILQHILYIYLNSIKVQMQHDYLRLRLSSKTYRNLLLLILYPGTVYIRQYLWSAQLAPSSFCLLRFFHSGGC